MKQCPKCKSEMKEKANFCSACGYSAIKYCKYCKSKIDSDAKVCPNCRQGLTWSNRQVSWLWFIPILILIIIGLYFYLSPNAPLKVREFFCASGMRKDRNYCSYFVWEKWD